MADPVLDGLSKVCDERARAATDADAVAGVPSRYVAAPASTDEVSEVLRLAAVHDLRVVVRGAGTKLNWGSPPRAVDLVLDTGLLNGVVEHAAGDLVVVVGAGTPVETMQATLGEADQQLAIDAPDGATIGGTVAANTSGPRRLLYGTLRDLLIGVTFVRADGVVAKAGGKVVKNVAGYDFGKLLTGSYGTLGVLTQVAFRLHPQPPARRVLVAEVADEEAIGRTVAAVVGSQVVPTAVEVDRPSDGPASVAVLLEGTEEGVSGRAEVTQRLMGGQLTSAGGDLPSWFGRYPFGSDEVGLKLTTEMSGLPRLLLAVRRTAAEHGVAIEVRGSAVGVLYAGMSGGTDPETVARVVDALRSAAAEHAGTVIVLTAPPSVHDHADVWGPVPGLDLMRRLKDQLDPEHRLAPGRFVGGI